MTLKRLNREKQLIRLTRLALVDAKISATLALRVEASRLWDGVKSVPLFGLQGRVLGQFWNTLGQFWVDLEQFWNRFGTLCRFGHN